MNYRLFLAIDPPTEIRNTVISICRGLEHVKWMSEEQIHITLRFIGDADGVMLREICDSLTQVEFNPFSLSLRGVGHFPPRGNPKVIWTGLDDLINIKKLYSSISRSLLAAGVEREQRKFSPHITLARVKDESSDSIASYLSRHSRFKTEAFSVSQYHLYTSTLTPKGAIHEKLASFLLE